MTPKLGLLDASGLRLVFQFYRTQSWYLDKDLQVNLGFLSWLTFKFLKKLVQNTFLNEKDL